MADTREKLALVVCEATQKTNHKCEFNCEKKGKCAYCLVMAEQMIAHGVTVQEWISVKDERKPNHGDIALCYMTFGEYRLLQWDDRSKLWVGDYMDYGFEDAAYWQMPQPPKGE